MAKAERLKVSLAASAGGHLTQLLKLSDSWQGYDTFCVTTTGVTRKRFEQHGTVYVVGESNHKHPIRVLKVFFRCIKIVIHEKPDVVISSGASAGCIMCFLGKLFGAKVVWVDSVTNVERISISGRMVRYISDLFLVQWPELAQQYTNVEYVGAVI